MKTVQFVCSLLMAVFLFVQCESDDGGIPGGGGSSSTKDVAATSDTAGEPDTVATDTQGTPDTTPVGCSTDVPCTSHGDCPDGHLCTEITSPPTCAKISCGGEGTACDASELCASPLVCIDGACRGAGDCVSTTQCATDGDCPAGHHCNEALQIPTCQKLYCGEAGSPCDEKAVCAPPLTCTNSLCEADTDPCLTGECSPACALSGTFDPDCFSNTTECDYEFAQELLTEWFEGAYTDVMSANTRNCDWAPMICDTQFRCNGIHCFCDPDCYIKDANGNWEAPPVCAADGHCDSWCPIFTDPDCAGHPDDGKYCG